MTDSTTIACRLQCTVPEGVRLLAVPVPRHAWPDVLVCPNDGCGRAFLLAPRPLDASRSKRLDHAGQA